MDHLPRETGDGTDTARSLAGYIASVYHLNAEAEDRIHSRIYTYGLDSAAAEHRHSEGLQTERDQLIDHEMILHKVRAEAEDRAEKAEARVAHLEAENNRLTKEFLTHSADREAIDAIAMLDPERADVREAIKIATQAQP